MTKLDDYDTWIAAQDRSAADMKRKLQRDAAVVTAVHVARDWAINLRGDNLEAEKHVGGYIHGWLLRNGAERRPQMDVVEDLVDAVWALAELPQQDPLTLVDDDYRGTSDEARAMLTAQYERDLQHALSRITWKA